MCSTVDVLEETNSNDETVTISVENEKFIVKRKLLTENCEYFNAMLSGSFKERSQNEIKIQIVTAAAFKFVIDYFETNVIGLFDFNKASEILDAVNYFNLECLQTLIINKLLSMMNNETCFQIYQLGKKYNLITHMPKINAYILNNFNELRNFIQNVPDLKSLFFYLSHENLNVTNEIDVFDAGCSWLREHKQENKILVILSCVVFKELNLDSVSHIWDHELVKNNSMALEVVKGIYYLNMKSLLDKVKDEKFIEDKLDGTDPEVCKIIYNFLKANRRKPPMRPCVVKHTNDKYTIASYNTEEKQVEEYENFAFSNWWGLSIMPWNKFYIVVSCGVLIKREVWNKEIKVYDCLREQWRVLPTFMRTLRRHPTALIHDDILYLFGGFGQHRFKLNSADSYNLKTGVWKCLPDIPNECTFGVAAMHNGNLYLCLDYLYLLHNNCWKMLFRLPNRICALMSFDHTLYYIERFHNKLYSWKDINPTTHACPEVNLIKKFVWNVVGICNIGRIFYVFGEGEDFEQVQTVESYDLDIDESDKKEILWIKDDCAEKFYSLSGAFLLPIFIERDKYINTYGERWIKS